MARAIFHVLLGWVGFFVALDRLREVFRSHFENFANGGPSEELKNCVLN